MPLITILNDCILCCFKNSIFLSLSYFSPKCFIPIDEYTMHVLFDASRKETDITIIGKKIKIFQMPVSKMSIQVKNIKTDTRLKYPDIFRYLTWLPSIFGQLFIINFIQICYCDVLRFNKLQKNLLI